MVAVVVAAIIVAWTSYPSFRQATLARLIATTLNLLRRVWSLPKWALSPFAIGRDEWLWVRGWRDSAKAWAELDWAGGQQALANGEDGKNLKEPELPRDWLEQMPFGGQQRFDLVPVGQTCKESGPQPLDGGQARGRCAGERPE
ncbi:unnamed protein product [Protopolystoma xenopodis]|uniref:Uncharacterized protein n=1 Tax=Protopolystoma xenopodis TaxID=117903 RepID=A0A448X0W3_9PLAT|nr:unnamed protein product [Protopolystoma xenopodis]